MLSFHRLRRQCSYQSASAWSKRECDSSIWCSTTPPRRNKKVSANRIVRPSQRTITNKSEPVHKDWNTLPEKEFLRDRLGFNPYDYDSTSSDPRFYCKMHQVMYEFVISRKENTYVPQQFLDVPWFRQNYPETMEILEFHNLQGLMGRHKDFNIELIKEFFATVYFHSDAANTMTWMSATTVCQATLADFARLLDLSVVDPSDSSYFRIHEPGQRQLSAKPHLYHCYDRRSNLA